MSETVQTTPTATKVINALARVTETEQVRSSLDMPLFELGLLDSLGMVQLMIALSEDLQLEISPAEIERDQWATPRKIIEYVEQRVGR